MRPRGLCWACYYAPGVRDLYPPTSKYARKGNGLRGDLTPQPTDAPPGSPAKFAVLCGRAERGEALWHPADNAQPGPETAYVQHNTTPCGQRRGAGGNGDDAPPRAFRVAAIRGAITEGVGCSY